MCSNADTNPRRKEERGGEDNDYGNERRVFRRMTNTCVYADNASEQLHVPYVKRYQKIRNGGRERERPTGPALPAILRNALIGLDRN